MEKSPRVLRKPFSSADLHKKYEAVAGLPSQDQNPGNPVLPACWADAAVSQ